MAMSIVPGSIEHLSEIISQVVAPAFLLGAVASFVSILVSRTNGVLQRHRDLRGLEDAGHQRADLKTDLPRLKWRAILLNRAVLLSIASGGVASLLIIVAFAAALVNRNHVWFAAILFMTSMLLLFCALVAFAMEVMIAVTEDEETLKRAQQ